MKIKLLLYINLLLLSFFCFSQVSSLVKGNLKDACNGYPIPFANVILLKGDSIVKTAQTDFDGNFNFLVDTGKYSVKLSAYLFSETLVNNFVVKKDSISKLNLNLENNVNNNMNLVSYNWEEVYESNKLNIVARCRSNTSEIYYIGCFPSKSISLPKSAFRKSPILKGLSARYENYNSFQNQYFNYK